MELDLFLGRFHPLIVHFPIALLVAAVAIEFLSKHPAFQKLAPAQPFVVLLGFVTAVLSVALGLLVSGDRGYGQSLLEWHRWSGFAVVGLSLLMLIIVTNRVRVSDKLRGGLFLLLLIVVSLTGHLGGSLTHGAEYLGEYAPEFLRGILSPSADEPFNELPENPDSLVVYSHLIVPIINKHCTGCHDSTQLKGGLNMLTTSAITTGGENGPVIKPGKSLESELFRRITLPPSHTKFMPLRKTPLSFGEVSLIRWWIDQGASFDGRLTDFDLDEDIAEILIRDYEYDPTPQPYYITVKVDSVSYPTIKDISSNGFIIKKLAKNNNFLSVSVIDSVAVDTAMLMKLLPIRNNITWLDLSGKNMGLDELQVVCRFFNLTVLNISRNPISDEEILCIGTLSHLETLNLYGSLITDESIKVISSIPSLKRVYLWRTQVTTYGIESLNRDRPNLVTDYGFSF